MRWENELNASKDTFSFVTQGLPHINFIDSKQFCRFRLRPYFCAVDMAERSNAAVLKTVDCHRSGGSNPSLSASARRSSTERRRAFYFHFFLPIQRATADRSEVSSPPTEALAQVGFFIWWATDAYAIASAAAHGRSPRTSPPSYNYLISQAQVGLRPPELNRAQAGFLFS